MKYQVYYSKSGLPKQEQIHALLPHMIEYHLSGLSTDIALHFHAKGVTSQVRIKLDEGNQYAEVYLDDGGQGLNLGTELADCIRMINMRTVGLCFLIRDVEQ